MAETDILNPDVRWRSDLDDSIGPNYGWEMLRRSQLAVVKPTGGRPWSRTVGNGGHSTQFSWLNRSRKCVEYLKRWAEEHEDGFFTVIDHDGGDRHYVGNFVGDMPITQAGNNRYNIQGWTFEEIPGCPMLQYPGDWDRWAVKQLPVDDYGDQVTATVSATANAWVRPAAVTDSYGVSRVPRQMLNALPTAGDWATHEYRGYGFRLWLGKGPAAGTVQVWVDGVLVKDNLRLYSAIDLGSSLVYENVAMPLDLHRVKVVVIAATPADATLQGFLWDRIEVMR